MYTMCILCVLLSCVYCVYHVYTRFYCVYTVFILLLTISVRASSGIADGRAVCPGDVQPLSAKNTRVIIAIMTSSLKVNSLIITIICWER